MYLELTEQKFDLCTIIWKVLNWVHLQKLVNKAEMRYV